MKRRAAIVISATITSTWQRLGQSALVVLAAVASTVMSPGTGEAGRLVVDFWQPQTLYRASDGGIAKSTDGGVTWALRNTGFPVSDRSLYVNALVMDPHDPTALYAGTQDLGIFKTTDGAATWVRLSATPTAVMALAIDPRMPTTLYAAAGQGTSMSASRVEHHSRVYKSVDGGTTWAIAGGALADPAITGVIVAPDAARTVYAITTLTGVVKSADGGATWQPAASGIGSRYITALVLDGHRPGHLYAGTADRGVFRSDDGGARWVQADRGLTNKVVSGLVPDPATPSAIYALTAAMGGPEVFRSGDAGATWTRMGSPAGTFGGSDVAMVFGGPELAIDPVTPSTLYLSAGGRGDSVTPVFKSHDRGATWARATALPTDITVWAVMADSADPGVLYAAVQVEHEPGIFKSSNGGASWTRSNAGLDGGAMLLVADPRDRATLYAATSELFKSADGGASWTRSSAGLPSHDTVSAVAIDPKDPATIYLGTLNSGIYKSVDGGRSWKPSAAGLDSHTVLAMAVDPHRTGTVYAVLRDLSDSEQWAGGPRTRERIGGIFKSRDGGATWSGSDAGLPLHVQALALDPFAPGVLYASVQSSGMFLSRDGGATWTARRPLPSPEVHGLRVTRPSTLYAWTSAGVFRTADGGASWIAASPLPGERAPALLAVAVTPGNADVVYAGTAARGLFKSANGGRSWQAINAVSSRRACRLPAPG